ncbi:MAG TPA: hypothetical protein VIS07_12165 [Candidatus Binatia bacterium]
MNILLSATAVVALLVAGSAHASELSTFESKLQKYAKRNNRINSVCVCQDGGAMHGRAGYVGDETVTPQSGTRAVSVSCGIPSFGPTGNLTGVHLCHPFVVLAQ